MNQVGRLRAKTSDFSIASILAHDRSPCSRQFCPDLQLGPFVSNVDQVDGFQREICASTPASSSSYSLANVVTTLSSYEEKREDEQFRDVRNNRFYRLSQRTEDDPNDCSSASNTSECSNNNELPWLRYTRYKPPKLPRKPSINKGAKRQPGTHPRIPFSSHQLRILEESYKKSAYMSRKDILELSALLRLPQNRVKIWFQNRRARERRAHRDK